jgi:transaldolase
MTRLNELFDSQNQSPWLDNLRRGWITGGELQGWIDKGVVGITSNPSIFQKAMSTGTDYDVELASLAKRGTSVKDSYWTLVVADIHGALDLLRPVYDRTNGLDGYVSVEVDPTLARDTEGTLASARALWARVDRPNVYIKVPATAEGVPAIKALIRDGINVNVTLIFGLARYDEVMNAFIDGLSERVAAGHPIAHVSSVASFFVSRVDSETDRRLNEIGTDEARALKGKAAVANAKRAYRAFLARVAGSEWEALAAAGATVQRPLWASTSTKDPSYPDTLYVDQLIGPHTVNTLPDATLAAFLDHGTVARTVDTDLAAADTVIEQLGRLGVDIDDVTKVLEDEGVAAFVKSFDDLLETLGAKVAEKA